MNSQASAVSAESQLLTQLGRSRARRAVMALVGLLIGSTPTFLLYHRHQHARTAAASRAAPDSARWSVVLRRRRRSTSRASARPAGRHRGRAGRAEALGRRAVARPAETGRRSTARSDRAAHARTAGAPAGRPIAAFR